MFECEPLSLACTGHESSLLLAASDPWGDAAFFLEFTLGDAAFLRIILGDAAILSSEDYTEVSVRVSAAELDSGKLLWWWLSG